MKNNFFFPGILALASTALLVGCNTQVTTLNAPGGGSNMVKTVSKPPADAAVSIPTNPSTKLPTVQVIASHKNYGYRNDPFRLLPIETRFDREQKTERVLVEAGGWQNWFTPTMDQEFTPPILQERPLWRISGVVVSENGVVALLDMGDHAMVIRPGMRIDGTPFVVESIDPDQAVLRRTDGLVPKYVVIELSGPLSGSPAFGGGSAGGATRPGSGAQQGGGARGGATE